MAQLISWMNGPLGRSVRMLAGAAMITGGVLLGGAGGTALAITGVIPLAAGASARCLIAPLFHQPARSRT